MPIPRSDLTQAIEKEKLPLTVRILRYLQSRPAEAFTRAEIYAAVEEVDPSSATLTLAILVLSAGRDGRSVPFLEALDELVAQKKVVSANVKADIYYSAAGES